MRKILLTLLLLFIFSVQLSFALEASEPASSYAMPYPGLLPDSPLYPLKTLRDRIVSMLISDPLKKAEFDLLQADKRLMAGLDLLKKNPKKEDLAISTISKGQNYLGESLDKIREAKSQGMEVSDILRKIKSSLRKHEELLNLQGKSIKKNKEFIRIEKRLENFQQQVDELIR